jgi:hypothetical protein
MNNPRENWDLLAFFVVIIAMSLLFVWTGLKLDEYRNHGLPNGQEEIP